MRLVASTVAANSRRVERTKVEGSEKKKERLEREETQDQGNPKRPSANAASTSLHPTGSAKPAQSMAPSAPLQPAESPQVCCTLWVPDSVTGHLICQVSHGLKLVATISKARIAVSRPSTESGAARKATIHGTSEEIGMALVIMGRRIAQQRVPNPQRALKPPKQPTPSLHPPPAIGQDPPTAANFAAGREAARVAALLTWPPDGIPPFATRTPPTLGAWDGEPTAHERRATPQQPAKYHARAIEQTDNEDNGPRTCRWSGGGPSCGCGHAPQAQERYSPTAEYHVTTIARLEAMVDTYTRALERVEDDNCGPQTARWSGGSPSRGRGHAPRAQGWTSPDCNPPTTECYAQVMAWIDTESPTADAYVQVIERDDDSQSRQTTRWSGSSPGRSCG
jgi:hypothetical protein